MFNHPVAKAFAASIAAGIATFALVPSANAATSARTTTVSYRNLDLGSDAGVATLKSRIAHAAGRVCDTNMASTLAERSITSDCRARAISNAQRGMVEVIAAADRGTRVASLETATRAGR